MFKICDLKYRRPCQKLASRPRPRALLSLWWLFRMYADQHTYLRDRQGKVIQISPLTVTLFTVTLFTVTPRLQ